MQRNLAFYMIICLLACGFFLTLLPYPTFYTGTYNVSKNDIEKINEANENEDISLQSQTPPTLHKLDWSECVSCLMPFNKPLKIVDVKSGLSFYINRIGGTMHADVIPTSEQDNITLQTLTASDSTQKRSIIVEIQPNIWSAGSLSCTPRTTNNQTHYCLHFAGSKTHATSLSDSAHQKAINYAFKHGKELIS